MINIYLNHKIIKRGMFCTKEFPSRLHLKVGKNRIDTRNSDIAARFLLKVSDLTVINDHGISSSSETKASRGQVKRVANRLGKVSITIRNKEDIFILESTHSLGPSVLDERIVGIKDKKLVNALGLEFRKLFNVGRNVVGSAGGSESTGDRDNDNLLGRKFLVSVVRNGDTAS